MPIPVPPTAENADDTDMEKSDRDEDWEELDEALSSGEPHFPNQQELDDLVRDLNLSKSSAELLVSRLKEWHLLDPNIRISKYRNRYTTYSQFFSMTEPLCFCTDIMEPFEAIG